MSRRHDPCSPRAARRGFTMIELMVSTVISVLILAAVAATMIGVQGAYQSEAKVKLAVEGGRGATDYVERVLKLAGYGIPPELAFDFSGPGSGFVKDNYENSARTYVSDDLAVRFRDPVFLRRGTFSGGTITLSSDTFGTDLRNGQAMMVACRGGRAFLIGRLSSAVSATANTASVSIFHTPPGVSSTDDCFTNTANSPFVMLVHERRFRIHELGGKPWLVVFHTLADVSTNTEYEPLAPNVEQFQVSYSMNRPSPLSKLTVTAPDTTGNGNWVLADATGESLPSATATHPKYTTPYDDVLRYNSSPANVRGVRVSMVFKSPSQNTKGKGMFKREALENAPAPPTTPDGYYRYTLQTQVRPPNMGSRSFFLPPVRQDETDSELLNFSGG